MISALIYLRVTSIVNAYRAKFRRLKQPRYLFGAIAGIAYFYFFFFRRLFSAHFGSHNDANAVFEFWQKAEPIGVLVLLLYLLSLWIFSSGRAALTFTEPEIAFLFPAPVSRRGLIHFKLLGGQLRVLISAAFFALVRTRMGGGPFFFVIQLFGWWTILSCISLHRIGAAFTRERLLEVGINPVRRRLIALVLVLSIGGLSYFWAKDRFSELLQDNASHPLELINAFVNTPPLSWVLWPLHLVVRPMFTNTIPNFLRAFGAAVLVLAIHYVWVIKSEVAFEEASITASRKRAEWIQAARAGKALQRGPKKRREEPFPLRAKGPRSVAFFWRNLIALGPFALPKWWILGAAIVIAVTRWLIGHPEYAPFLTVMTMLMSILAGYGFLLSPVFVRRPSQRLIEEIDVIKAYPLRGWEIILGEMLAPMALISCFEWIAFTVLVLIAQHRLPQLSGLPIAAAIGAAQIVPFLVGVLFSLNFAGVLVLPAWTYQPAQNNASGGGVDKLGQRLIFTAGYLLVAVVSLIPAAGIGAAVFFSFKLLLDQTALGAVLAGTAAALTLAGEFAAILWWLGERYENFDVSAELPRS
jgi:hypothetical protein